MSQFERARQETVRYHEELYSTADLGSSGTWLARPHQLIHEALAFLPDDRTVIAYDLGAGIGRHTVPLIGALPDGSTIHAVDLLDSAVRRLEHLAPKSGRTRLLAERADLIDFEFSEEADLVFAFSAVEHLADVTEIRRLFEKVRTALRPDGIVALGIVADRWEVDADGSRRPALLESGITVADVDDLLAASFEDFEVLGGGTQPAQVVEHRGDDEYLLSSTLVTWIGRRRVRTGE